MKKHGFVMMAAVSLLAVLASLLTAYFVLTNVETSVTQSSSGSTAGLYAAEAGLNIRAEQIRQAFVGYTRPSGTSPSSTDPCTGSNQGSGAFVCADYTFQNRTVRTFVEEAAGNPIVVDPIPPGELYQGLSAQEYRYSVFSRAINNQNRPEAILEMRFRSRLVPMFQFAAFYNKDLEILPGPNMTLNGPVHTNGDLYLNSENTLTINGQITTANDLYRGRKNTTACNGTVNVYDPSNPTAMNCGSGRQMVTNVSNWNGMIETQVEALTVPEPEELDPLPTGTYFSQADLRIVYDISVTPRVIQVRNADNSVNTTATTALLACSGTVTNGANTNRAVGMGQFYNRREGRQIELLEVDVRGLLNCIHNNVSTVGGGRALDDSTQGGLVWHFTVLGPNAGGNLFGTPPSPPSNYGVRVRNGETLASNVSGAPAIRGLTIVTDQALYVQGNYNGRFSGGTNVDSDYLADPQEGSSRWRPAAFLADSINVLSNAWNNDQANAASCANPAALHTIIQAGFLSGTDTTGSIEGTGGQGGAYNGGLENYPRFHENWSGQTLNYRGSFVSLNRPRKVNGGWGSQCYSAPSRDWSYESRFDNAANLPPLSPRFVYLVQELFVRQFEQ